MSLSVMGTQAEESWYTQVHLSFRLTNICMWGQKVQVSHRVIFLCLKCKQIFYIINEKGKSELWCWFVFAFCEKNKNTVSVNVSSFTKSGFKGIYQSLKFQGRFFDQMGFMIFACSCKYPSSVLLGKKNRLITVQKLTWLNADFLNQSYSKLFKLWHFKKSPSNNTNTSYWIGPHIARKSSRITTCHS